MSRWEFMRQLEELLSDISPSEREEALQYYNDYFNDAGKENEQEVIKALGSPEQVAAIVKEGLSENGSCGEFTENGFTEGNASVQNAIIKRNTKGQDEEKQKDSEQTAQKHTEEKEDSMPTWAIVLIVIGCVFLSPVILGLVCAVLGILIAIVASILGVVFGIGLAMVILYIVAIALVIGGFGSILAHPIAGVGLIGGGCICAALGILFMLLEVLLVGKCIPGIFEGIGYIFKKLFGKKGV